MSPLSLILKALDCTGLIIIFSFSISMGQGSLAVFVKLTFGICSAIFSGFVWVRLQECHCLFSSDCLERSSLCFSCCLEFSSRPLSALLVDLDGIES